MSDAAWRVIILPKAEKDLARLPPADQRRVRVAIDALTGGPDQGNYKAKKMHGGYALVIGVFVSLPARQIIRW